MSNSRRRSEPEPLPQGQSEQAQTSLLKNPSEVPTPSDHLADYRKSLEDLSIAAEKVATLRQVEISLRADAEGIATAREKVLADSVTSSSDDDGALEELGRLRSRAELFERKLADVAGRIRDAEAELASFCSGLGGCFSTLQRGLLAWAFERARVELSNLLDGGIASHIIDLCATHHITLLPIRGLEVIASDPETLLTQGTRLLEAVQAADGFQVPAYSGSASGGLAGAPQEPPKPRLVGPWADRPGGMSQKQINDELYRIRVEHPEFTLGRAEEELQRLYPQLYISQEEFMKMNEPLPPARSPLQAQEAA